MTVAISNTTFSSGALTGTAFATSVVRATGEGFEIGIQYEGDFGAPSPINEVRWDPSGDNQLFEWVDTQQSGGGLNRWLAVYALKTAASSAKTGNITVNFTASTNIDRVSVLVRHITGHNTTTMVRASAKSNGTLGSTNSPQSTTLASATGDLAVGFMSIRDETTYVHASAGQSNEAIYAHSSVNTRTTASSTKAGAASVTMGWTSTDSTSYDYAHIVTSIAPASATAPGAPTIGTATAGNGTASVAGTAPASDGGSAITGYTATSTPGSITGTSATLPVTVPGLTPGTAYTFTLHATNGIGNSSESASSNSVTPYSVSGVTVSPSTATVAGGATQTFTATVAGTSSPPQTVNWTTNAGSITSGGVLTAPATTGSVQTVTVTATSAVDGSKSGTATVTVPAGTPTVTSVTVSPSSATVSGGGTQTFTATVAGTFSPSQSVNWSANAGSITSAGVFTAPASTGSVQTVTVTASSVVDGSKTGTATVTVPATGSTVTGVTVSPSAPTVAGGANQTFTATVAGTGSPSQAVTWTRSGSAGSITSGGVFTAPATTGSIQTITITATSQQDGSKSGTATVTVPATATVTFTPVLPLKRGSSGALRTALAVRVSVLNSTTDVPIVTVASITTHATTAVPPAFTVAGPVAGTSYPVKMTNIADATDYALFNLTPA